MTTPMTMMTSTKYPRSCTPYCVCHVLILCSMCGFASNGIDKKCFLVVVVDATLMSCVWGRQLVLFYNVRKVRRAGHTYANG
ncbi:hypothetical protein DEU56DRAFT_820946 [Suillus clintonianus]|uniref:uncharacterized protein n=1 Tax=Suillus clintonianus TaxID=1904413 RepID=UPI001B85E213|nr:uncharacterized protein DEU56DRAFT_820946 [Suillus clintonianus]KAG2127238.1 hypothetical protein DEU56DRAFT_820946 [Suillus clintonianus]